MSQSVSPQPEVSTRPIATTLELVQAVIALAEEFPSAEYIPVGDSREEGGATCDYLRGEVLRGPPNCTGCLIGQATRRLVPHVFETVQYPATPAHDLALQLCQRHISGELDWLTEVQSRQDGGTCWLNAIEAADAKFGRPGLPAQCNRCGSPLVVNFCQDQTCPFSNHEQHCPIGWSGHPEHPHGKSVSCTCRTAASRGMFMITADVSKEDPLGRAVGYWTLEHLDGLNIK